MYQFSRIGMAWSRPIVSRGVSSPSGEAFTLVNILLTEELNVGEARAH